MTFLLLFRILWIPLVAKKIYTFLVYYTVTRAGHFSFYYVRVFLFRDWLISLFFQGIYISKISEDGPAALDERLQLGDKLLSVRIDWSIKSLYRSHKPHLVISRLYSSDRYSTIFNGNQRDLTRFNDLVFINYFLINCLEIKTILAWKLLSNNLVFD